MKLTGRAEPGKRLGRESYWKLVEKEQWGRPIGVSFAAFMSALLGAPSVLHLLGMDVGMPEDMAVEAVWLQAPLSVIAVGLWRLKRWALWSFVVLMILLTAMALATQVLDDKETNGLITLLYAWFCILLPKDTRGRFR